MKMVIARSVGYGFLVLSIASSLVVIIVSFRELSPAAELDFWITVLLCLVYFCGLIIAFWNQTISGILLLSVGLAIGIPTAILNIWAGVFYGLPPMIAGIAFLIGVLFFSLKQTSST